MGKFDELKKKVKDQIFCGIAKGEVEDDDVTVTIDDITYYRWRGASDELIDGLIEALDKNWEEKHESAQRDAKPKPIGVPKSLIDYRLPHGKEGADEIEHLIESRSNGTYNDISDTASEIIKALGTDSKYTYFFSQIANKLARIKNGYSVEDSLLDIAGYAKLELEKERKNER